MKKLFFGGRLDNPKVLDQTFQQFFYRSIKIQLNFSIFLL